MGTATGIIIKSSAYIKAGDFFMNKKNSDFIIKNVLLQFIICSVIFLLILYLSKSNSSLFSVIKKTYSSELEKNISSEEVQDAFNHIGGLFSSGNKKENSDVVAEIDAGGKDISAKDKEKIAGEVSLKKYTLNKTAVLPLKGEITSAFGYRIHPISGEYGFHSGTDIAAAEGTDILSAFDGVVIKAGYNEWNGNYLKIKHSDSVVTMYCHCKKLFVKNGTEITAGEKIASVGSTGNSTGPHLHFEVIIDNISYNPIYLLKGAVDEI